MYLSLSLGCVLIFRLNVFTKSFSYKAFLQNLVFCGSLEINLSMGRNTGRGKVACSWISPDPAKAGPTLGRGGGGVVVGFSEIRAEFEAIRRGFYLKLSIITRVSSNSKKSWHLMTNFLKLSLPPRSAIRREKRSVAPLPRLRHV